MREKVSLVIVSVAATCTLLFSLPAFASFAGEPAAETPAASSTSTNAQTAEDAGASEETSQDAGAASEQKESKKTQDVAATAKDNIVETSHTARIQGKDVSYTAQTGTMVLTSGGSTCEIFFTAYILDGTDNAKRPITFAFNGGPGCSSSYLNLGLLGPRTLDIDEEGRASSIPTALVDNEDSLLDMTDIVLIDPVGTGYSRSLEDTNDEFIGMENDARTVGDFIRLYLNRNKRWDSPKYLCGESYGTIRAVEVTKYLTDTYGMYLNGVMLVSAINDGRAVDFTPGNDVPYATYLPTYAADAWYQKALDDTYQKMELTDLLDEVCAFVEKEYVPALFKGSNITDEERTSIAKRYASYTGLSEDFVLSCDLRVDSGEFLSELLADRDLVVGRFDGRMTGPKSSGSAESMADPSDTTFGVAFGDAYLTYVTSELGFDTDVPYIPDNDEVFEAWSYGETGFEYPSQEDTIFQCLTKNPFLKIWVLGGYFDGATPFYSSDYTYAHAFLTDEMQERVTHTRYPSGHMIYMEKTSRTQVHKDAKAFFAQD